MMNTWRIKDSSVLLARQYEVWKADEYELGVNGVYDGGVTWISISLRTTPIL